MPYDFEAGSRASSLCGDSESLYGLGDAIDGVRGISSSGIWESVVLPDLCNKAQPHRKTWRLDQTVTGSFKVQHMDPHSIGLHLHHLDGRYPVGLSATAAC